MRMTPREFNSLVERRKLKYKENARPKPTKPLDKYKSNLEREFATTGYLHVGLFVDRKILSVTYEPIRIQLPGGSFKIDWRLETLDEYLWCETKSKHTKNYRDARSKLRAAAALFKKWRFFEVRKEHGRWIVEEIT